MKWKWATVNMSPWNTESVGTSARYSPVTPPIRKFTPKAMANSMGASNRIRPRQSVPTRAKNISPVGIEISSVSSMIGVSSGRFAPDQYRWCIQTVTLSTKMPIMPPTTSRYPHSGLRAKTVITSHIAPTAGSRITYTSGCPMNQKSCS